MFLSHALSLLVYFTMLITILIMTGPLLLHVNVCCFANCCESGYSLQRISAKSLQEISYQYNTNLPKHCVFANIFTFQRLLQHL